MSIKPFQFYAEVEGLSTRVDNSVKVTLGTQELDPTAVSKLFEIRGKYAWVMVAAEEIKFEDIKVPEKEPEFKKDKSPSERLRSVLFVLHKQTKVQIPFQQFYEAKMEEVIEHFKSKIPDGN
jgi:hypothetical protein